MLPSAYLIKMALRKQPEDDTGQSNVMRNIGLGIGGAGLASLPFTAQYRHLMYGSPADDILKAKEFSSQGSSAAIRPGIISNYISGANEMASSRLAGVYPLGHAMVRVSAMGEKQPVDQDMGRYKHFMDYSKGPDDAFTRAVMESVQQHSEQLADRAGKPKTNWADFQEQAALNLNADKVLDSYSSYTKAGVKPKEAILATAKENPEWAKKMLPIVKKTSIDYGGKILANRPWSNRAMAGSLGMAGTGAALVGLHYLLNRKKARE